MDFSQELADFVHALNLSIQKHGDKPYHSPHEGLGVCHEELYELTKEVHGNNLEEIKNEFRDLAIASFWGYVSCSKMKSSEQTT